MKEPTPETNHPNNPYAASGQSSDVVTETLGSHSRPMRASITGVVGFFYGAAFGALAGLGLNILVLLPPMNHWFGFDHGYALLSVVVIPQLCAGCGALAGLTCGAMNRRTGSRRAGFVVAALLAIAFVVTMVIKSPQDQLMQVVGTIVGFSGATAVVALKPLFRHIARRRLFAQAAFDANGRHACSMWMNVITTGWTVTVAIGGAGLPINQLQVNRLLDWTLITLPVLVLLTTYRYAVYPDHRSVVFLFFASLVLFAVEALQLLWYFS